MEARNRSFSNFKKILLFILLPVSGALLLNSCDLNSSTDGVDLSEDSWIIPASEIVDGGPGKDGIPSIDDPDFDSLENTNYVPDDRMVVGIRVNGEVRAYPHQILDWHEIVNDKSGDDHFAIVYCPLTGTGMSWNREIDGSVTEFGVSGLLFRNNLIAYDRNTDSNWSQMQLRSVNGEFITREIETYQLVETTWETWKQLFPDSKVHTTNTGHSRNYNGFTYGPTYHTDHNRILFPVRNTDDRLQNKDRVHGIIESDPSDSDFEVRVYVIDEFGDGVNLIRDQLANNEYLVAGSTEYNIAAAFKLDDPTLASLDFFAVDDELPVVFRDSEGTSWDIFGTALDGPREGDRLTAARSYTGYWFGWADFFPDLEIYGR